MQLGLALPTFGPDARPEGLLHVCRTAEEMGYDSLWTGDRVLAPLVPGAPYPSGGGVMPRAYENHMDPLVALTFVASHTTRVRLGTSTLNGLWQPPIMLARSLTTLDVLSRGRLVVGLGLGWMPDEYTAVAVPWEGRGPRLDETLDVLEEYWANDVFAHEGPLFTIPETVVGLKPAQRPGPPVLLAAFSPGGLRRIGRRFGGWLPVAMPLPYLMGMWDTILKEAVEAERDPSTLRMALRVNPQLTESRTDPGQMPRKGTLTQYIDYARAAAEAGVHELFVDFGQTTATLAERVDLAGRFLDGVRAG
ncbi:TIGR03619 family F420-dependent LLM class oxidoreductase (plasmid) [Streptomyces sp. FXJ1.172]|uniref:TIGR03619 family F420-dependent LLM class oxidoreductase n=1 Tax=Streptomyces sp. FXJ1.172 TaxID=710705 RepID=UPI0023DCFECA|nr:TIGR03619 family F420-dependent LLM class oxidoreductase [Streptomyces sp. FXJ1.172]WEP00811.1 TIGR03619 family F420-dependent LLM class oxidoreductase [Streptomyces sp. FXJ1.172]